MLACEALARERFAGGRVTSPVDERRCGWCRRELATTAKRSARFCGKKCRQSAFRLRCRGADVVAGVGDDVATFAYADPPYPGLAAKYYRNESTFAGEVDHAALIASLTAGGYAGWALSTSSRALRAILPLCPPDARVCAWVKPIGVPPATNGIHATWEALIVVGGRQRPPGVRDFLSAQPARNEGTLPGRKPIAFCAWLFDCLGMVPGDTLLDLFPGTGIVSRAWDELSSRTSATDANASLLEERRFARRWLPAASDVNTKER